VILDAEIHIKDHTLSLGQLVDSLLAFQSGPLEDAFDERWQLEVGQYLYEQIFRAAENIKPELLRDGPIEVRIITRDEHIARLPWVLLSRNGVFLSAAGWSVAFSSSTHCQDHELPPSPQTLICLPEPAGVPRTNATVHLDDIEDMLSASDRLLIRDRKLRVVTNWEDFLQATHEFRPHVVYYYGHGIGDVNTSRLVFASRKKNERIDVPIVDVANELRSVNDSSPLLVYLNCCYGDVGGILGAGRQLSFVPAVITNYTLANIPAAQAQGRSLLQSILLDAKPPHVAIRDMRNNSGRLGLSFKDIRWMTPLLHYQYDRWKANSPQPLGRLERDPHWRFKVDRVRQFAQVSYLTRQMLREQKPRSMAYLWYGQEGQGVDLFHQRLKVELQEDLRNTLLYEVRPEWPIELSNPHLSWQEMLSEAFDVQEFDDISSRIRTQTRGVSDRRTLVYVRHQSVRSSKLITPAVLKSYLEWWDCNFVPLLGNQAFGLLGVSFVVRNPPNFLRALNEKHRITDLEFNATVLQVLDEMEKLSKQDLMAFLQTHNIRLPPQRRDRLLERILKESNGNYEITLELLKEVIERAWDPETETQLDNTSFDYSYD